MALPPTPLTLLLAHAAGNPRGMTQALASAGLLAASDPEAQRAVATCIEATLERAEARPPHPGPTAIDLVAQALVHAGYLNSAGLRAASGAPLPPSRPRGWWISVFLFAYGLKMLSARYVGFTYPGAAPFDLGILQYLLIYLIFLTAAVIPTRWFGRGWLVIGVGVWNAITELAWLFALSTDRRSATIVAISLALAVLGVGITWVAARYLQGRTFAG